MWSVPFSAWLAPWSVTNIILVRWFVNIPNFLMFVSVSSVSSTLDGNSTTNRTPLFQPNLSVYWMCGKSKECVLVYASVHISSVLVHAPTSKSFNTWGTIPTRIRLQFFFFIISRNCWTVRKNVFSTCSVVLCSCLYQCMCKNMK